MPNRVGEVLSIHSSRTLAGEAASSPRSPVNFVGRQSRIVHIRAAIPVDARAIAEIHVSTWRVAYRGLVTESHLNALSVDTRESQWRRSIETRQPTVLVAEDPQGLSGWVAFGSCRDPDKSANVGEIWAIYVSPARWSTGVGRALWLTAREHLQTLGFRAVTLWAFAQNERASNFYRNAGFRPQPGSSKIVEIDGVRLEEVRYEAFIAA